MGASPDFKVYSADGKYLAACHYPEDAAAILTARGHGTSIRVGHAKRDTMYTNGVDGDARDGYDAVVDAVRQKVEEWRRK